MATRGFTGRRPAPEVADRVPPGQSLTDDFPVLSAGPTPRVSLGDWSFTLKVGPRPVKRWTWAEFQTLPRSKMTRVAADLVAVVCAVTEQDTRVAVPLLHQVGVGSGVVSFTGRQHNPNREAVGVSPEVDLCREAAARAPEALAHGPAPRAGGALVRPDDGADARP